MRHRTGRRSRFMARASRVAVVLAVLTYVLFPASPAVDLPVYEVGSVASDNVIAPFAFRVLKTPAELKTERDAVVRGVEPVFDFVPAALDSARQALAAFNSAIIEAAAADPTSPVPASSARRGELGNATHRSAGGVSRRRTAASGAHAGAQSRLRSMAERRRGERGHGGLRARSDRRAHRAARIDACRRTASRRSRRS